MEGGEKVSFYFMLSGVLARKPPATAHQRQGGASHHPGLTGLELRPLWLWIHFQRIVRQKIISGWICRCDSSLAEHKAVNVLKAPHCSSFSPRRERREAGSGALWHVARLPPGGGGLEL